jgi:hypothetical protein
MPLCNEPARAARTHCIGCGCHDLGACWDEAADQTCHWLVLDRHAGLGVCSSCPEDLARWQQGDREAAVPVERHDGRRDD